MRGTRQWCQERSPAFGQKTARNPGENKGPLKLIPLEAGGSEIHGNWRRDVRKEGGTFPFPECPTRAVPPRFLQYLCRIEASEGQQRSIPHRAWLIAWNTLRVDLMTGVALLIPKTRLRQTFWGLSLRIKKDRAENPRSCNVKAAMCPRSGAASLNLHVQAIAVGV